MAAQKIIIRLNKASTVLPPEMPTKIEEIKSWNFPRVLAFFIVLSGLLFLLFKGISHKSSVVEGAAVVKPSEMLVVPSREIEHPGASASNERSMTGEKPAGSIVQAEDRKKIPLEDRNQIALEPPAGFDVNEGAQTAQRGTKLENSEVVFNRGVTKAQFTHAVRNNKPVDRISSPVHVSSEKAITLSFFNTLEGMAGELVSHRWQHGGQTIAEIKFAVKSDPWSVYSSKYLNETMVGRWTVVVLDSAGVELKSEDILIVNK